MVANNACTGRGIPSVFHLEAHWPAAGDEQRYMKAPRSVFACALSALLLVLAPLRLSAQQQKTPTAAPTGTYACHPDADARDRPIVAWFDVAEREETPS